MMNQPKAKQWLQTGRFRRDCDYLALKKKVRHHQHVENCLQNSLLKSVVAAPACHAHLGSLCNLPFKPRVSPRQTQHIRSRGSEEAAPDGDRHAAGSRTQMSRKEVENSRGVYTLGVPRWSSGDIVCDPRRHESLSMSRTSPNATRCATCSPLTSSSEEIVLATDRHL